MPCVADALVPPSVRLVGTAAGARGRRRTALIRLLPSALQLDGMYGRQVLVKWWYAAALTRGGFHVLLSDADVRFLRDPLAGWGGAYDLEALSDIRQPTLTSGRDGVSHGLVGACHDPWHDAAYRTVAGRHSNGVAPAPCLSTSLVYLRSSCATMLATLVDFITANATWGQPDYFDFASTWAFAKGVFQVMVVRYAIGLGDEVPPLHARLLPPERFANVEAANASAKLVAVHAGYVPAEREKLRRLRAVSGARAREH